MPAPVKIKNAVDAHVTQAFPNNNTNGKTKLWLQTSAGANRYAWIYFTKPWPTGATIISAKLHLYNWENLTTSTTLTVQRASAKWRVNRITYNDQPGLTGSTAVLTKATASPETRWEIDVTALLQAVANGAPWFGFRISTNRTTAHSLIASESPLGYARPTLIVEWAMPPEEPENLVPREAQVAFVQKPVLRWDYDDPGGDNLLAAIQVRIGSSQANVEAGTTTYDSGERASVVPEFDLATTVAPLYAGVTAGTQQWWQARNKDSSGLWSVWSDPAAVWTWAARGVLTITAPASGGLIYTPTPTITWTFTGQTQRAYQVAVALACHPNDWLWTSGKITASTTSVEIPENILTDAGATYRVVVRVWEATDRVATPGQALYAEQTRDMTFAYDGTIDTHVTALTATADPLYPIMTLNWNRSGAVLPTGFVIQRSEDAGATWVNLDRVTEPEVLVSGTAYQWKDVKAAQYTAYTWRVMPINATNGRMTSGNPTVTGQSRRLAPFLYRPNGTDAVCFLNPKRPRRNLDVQAIHEPVGGPPVLVTQRIGGKAGTVEGRFADDVLAGVTAKEMYARFNRMRDDAGTPLYLAIANETYEIVAYNFQDDVLTDASGITYLCSFDWIEVPFK